MTVGHHLLGCAFLMFQGLREPGLEASQIVAGHSYIWGNIAMLFFFCNPKKIEISGNPGNMLSESYL